MKTFLVLILFGLVGCTTYREYPSYPPPYVEAQVEYRYVKVPCALVPVGTVPHVVKEVPTPAPSVTTAPPPRPCLPPPPPRRYPTYEEVRREQEQYRLKVEIVR